MTTTNDLMSVTQLAEHLGIPLATIYRWNSSGAGPRRIKIGKHVRYRVSDVEAWLETRYTDQDKPEG